MIQRRFRRPTFWLLAVLLVIAAVLRFRALDFGLPHTQTRPDETAIIEGVRTLMSGHLPRFYDYPWLFLWIVLLGYIGYFVWGLVTGAFVSLSEMLASWPLHWEPFFLIPRALSAAFGTASVFMIYRLGRQLRDDATGIIAALFLTFTFIHVLSSHFGTTDVAMTFLIIWAVSLLIDAHHTRRRWEFAGAGLVAGLAAATKYNALALAVPMVVSHVLTMIDSPGRRWEALRDNRILYFGAAFALAFSIGIPFVVFDRAPFLDAIQQLAHALQVGDTRIDLGNGWVHHLTFSLRYGLGLPLLTTGLAGVIALLWLEPRVGVLLLSFPIAYYAVIGGVRLLFFRYAMPVIPFLCVTAAYFVCRAAGWLARRLTRFGSPAIVFRVVATALALALVWPSAANVWSLDRVLGEEDNRVVVARWFYDHVPAGSSVLQSGARYGLIQFWDRGLAYKEWRWDTARRVFLIDGKRPHSSDRPDWIVVQDSPLPSTTQPIVIDLLKKDYTFVAEFNAVAKANGLVYDSLDAFYVPFAGFEHVVRPGPNFSVFRREGADRGDEPGPVGQ